MKTVHVAISGVVQGVGYRAWLYRKANMLDVSGWCKNNADGSVEAVISGDEEKVDALMMAAQVGPPSADVEDIRQVETDPTEETGPFRILY